jgi:hypothetical protein
MINNSTYISLYGDVRIGAFEEVLSIPGRFLNDHCLIQKNDQWHFFGCVGDASAVEVSLAHATSNNLKSWQIHSDVLNCSSKKHEIEHVFAPYVIEHDGLFYMLYCTNNKMNTQCIRLATSKDLFHWEPYGDSPVILPSLFWSKWPGFGLDKPDEGTFGSCRDPHIIKLDDGTFVAYWVSRLQEKFGSNMVCAAASVSHDLIHWQEIGPIFAMKAWHQPLTMELESPCVVYKDGRYWLFFKHGWWTHVAVSNSPFDFWGREPIRLGYSHASEIFYWDNNWWITHCKTDHDDFMQSKSDGTRGMFLSKLDWPQGAYPKLCSL